MSDQMLRDDLRREKNEREASDQLLVGQIMATEVLAQALIATHPNPKALEQALRDLATQRKQSRVFSVPAAREFDAVIQRALRNLSKAQQGNEQT